MVASVALATTPSNDDSLDADDASVTFVRLNLVIDDVLRFTSLMTTDVGWTVVELRWCPGLRFPCLDDSSPDDPWPPTRVIAVVDAFRDGVGVVVLEPFRLFPSSTLRLLRGFRFG